MTLLPPKKAAAKLGVSVTTLNEWRRKPGDHPLPPRRVVNGRAMWLDADLDAWMAALPQEPARAS